LGTVLSRKKHPSSSWSLQAFWCFLHLGSLLGITLVLCVGDVSGEGVSGSSHPQVYLESPRCREVPRHQTALLPAPTTSPDGDRLPRARDRGEGVVGRGTPALWARHQRIKPNGGNQKYQTKLPQLSGQCLSMIRSIPRLLLLPENDTLP